MVTCLLVISRDDIIATKEFAIADLLDDGINGEYEMYSEDGEPVGTVNVNINYEAGEGKSHPIALAIHVSSKVLSFLNRLLRVSSPYVLLRRLYSVL